MLEIAGGLIIIGIVIAVAMGQMSSTPDRTKQKMHGGEM
ncbi:Uncharacterised protein [Shigella sonnei]|nr:Uncharacterised protein [Shigella sonnei]